MSKPQTFRIHSQADLFSIPIETEGELSFITLPVLPAGQFQHPTYGVLDWTAEKFARMIANLDAKVTGYEPMLNVDHATHNPFAAECPAYGWIKSLLIGSDGGLYARIELTDLGVEAIRSKRYRYTSAEVTSLYTNSKGEEFQDVICGLALTNTPFHDTMPGTFSRPAADPQLTAQFAQCFATLEGDLSFDEVRRLVSDAVRAEVETVPGVYRWIDDVFPSFVIYEEWSCAGNRETEKHYKRGYTIADRTVTLATEIVEVEEVWVEVARQAFSAARRQVAVQRFGAQQPPNPADDPAKERTSMSQDKKPKQSFGQSLWNYFGFGKAVTQEQFTQAVDSAPAQAAEPAEDTPNDTTLSQTPAEVIALRQQVAALNGRIEELSQERKDEQLELSKKAAETAVQAYVQQGKITPAMLEGERGAALREFARTQPKAFAAIYDAAPQLVPLNKLGFAGEPAGSSDGGDAETFNGLVERVQAENPGMDPAAAIEFAADLRPDLYQATLPKRNR